MKLKTIQDINENYSKIWEMLLDVKNKCGFEVELKSNRDIFVWSNNVQKFSNDNYATPDVANCHFLLQDVTYIERTLLYACSSIKRELNLLNVRKIELQKKQEDLDAIQKKLEEYSDTISQAEKELKSFQIPTGKSSFLQLFDSKEEKEKRKRANELRNVIKTCSSNKVHAEKELREMRNKYDSEVGGSLADEIFRYENDIAAVASKFNNKKTFYERVVAIKKIAKHIVSMKVQPFNVLGIAR